MGASFEEKSVWVRLSSLVVLLAFYFAIASKMLAAGVTEALAMMPVFIVAVILQLAVLVAGHVVAALTGRREARDERDRLISWRAEGSSSWLLAVGVLAAVTALAASWSSALVAHVLIVSLIAHDILKCTLQVAYYRRGL